MLSLFGRACTRRAHVGDMANLVFSYGVDAERMVSAPIDLEEHSLVGAAAVAMPGTRLGKGATLGAVAATQPGAQLPGVRQLPCFMTALCVWSVGIFPALAFAHAG